MFFSSASSLFLKRFVVLEHKNGMKSIFRLILKRTEKKIPINVEPGAPVKRRKENFQFTDADRSFFSSRRGKGSKRVSERELEKNYFYSPSGALLCFDKFLWLSLYDAIVFPSYSLPFSAKSKELGNASHTHTHTPPIHSSPQQSTSKKANENFSHTKLDSPERIFVKRSAKLWQSHLLLFFTVDVSGERESEKLQWQLCRELDVD